MFGEFFGYLHGSSGEQEIIKTPERICGMTHNELEQAANNVVNHLKSEGAVRAEDDEIGHFIPVFELCDALGIYMGDWTKIKNHLLKRGVDICYRPGKGHYLGGKGEKILNVAYKYRIAKGWVNHMKGAVDAIKQSSPQERAWIDRRFKDFTVEE